MISNLFLKYIQFNKCSLWAAIKENHMSKLSLDKNNQRALVAAIVASGTDDLNVMFLAFSMSSIIS